MTLSHEEGVRMVRRTAWLLGAAPALVLGLVLGYVARDQRPFWFPKTSGNVRVLVGPQPDGTMSLQINMDGRGLGWIALSPDTTAYLRAKLAELP